MKKKLLLIATAALLSLPSIPSALAQHVYIQVEPPHIRVEHPGHRPHPGWYWRAGYYRWDGHAHVWMPGEWIGPPHPHAVWVDGRWHHEHGGWYWEEGHWR
jgi:hypothetical protein